MEDSRAEEAGEGALEVADEGLAERVVLGSAAAAPRAEDVALGEIFYANCGVLHRGQRTAEVNGVERDSRSSRAGVAATESGDEGGKGRRTEHEVMTSCECRAKKLLNS